MNKHRTFLSLAIASVLIALTVPAFAGDTVIRKFDLHYQDTNFVVPKGELWKLTWKTPYAPGAVVPAYDVRVVDGSALMGEDRNTQVQVYQHPEVPVDKRLLDISAARKKTTVWLFAGTTFEIANDFLKIHVVVYKDE